MSKIRYMREGRGLCKKCARELDVVTVIAPAVKVPGPANTTDTPREVRAGVVIARHLNRIEEYGPKGASPRGFCLGSLGEADPVKTPERSRGGR